ncbi:putative leader peptide [Nocardioides ginsengisoli]|uniref:Leader peptide n=1 Tax=Nocardioides ginsengisoli TaxID=363868 RepID=A0ABW3W3F0_9ACTN
MDTRLDIWDAEFVDRAKPPRLFPMSTTLLLTKRRAVDNCRVSSALCRPC